MLFDGLTRGLPGGGQNRGPRHLGGPASAIVLPDGKKTPYTNAAIDPLDAGDLALDGARLRGLRRTGLVATFMGRLFWQSWLSRYLNARKDVLRAHRPRTRSGVLDHLQQPARNTIDLPVLVKVDGRRAG
jgi:hypothetical protein